jgi:septum formation protein
MISMLVLASQSPRRRELLANAGIAHVVRVSGVLEERIPEESPADYVLRLSHAKAEAVTALESEIVLGADTVVVIGDEVLEKPASPEDATRMLRLLSGATHSVFTGICLLHRGLAISEVVETKVTFGHLSEAEMRGYLRSDEPWDKAGGYAIQGLASKFIERIEGSYTNVVGLPVSEVYRHLQQIQKAAEG